MTRSQAGIMVLLGAVLLALAGCGSSGFDGERMAFVEFDAEQKQAIESGGAGAYRIQEGDVLRIAFPYEKALTQDDVLVLSDGAATLVGIDRVHLAGLTISEADSVITSAYAHEYIEPDLSVIIMETTGRRVYVLGEVRNPGIYRVPQGGIGVVGAITLAGGFNGDAAKDGTVLVRVTPDGYLVQELPLGALHKPEGAPLAMVELQSYDVIYVPRSRAGDFGYFSRTILTGLMNITRIASDIHYLSGATYGRY